MEIDSDLKVNTKILEQSNHGVNLNISLALC